MTSFFKLTFYFNFQIRFHEAQFQRRRMAKMKKDYLKMERNRKEYGEMNMKLRKSSH